MTLVELESTLRRALELHTPPKFKIQRVENIMPLHRIAEFEKELKYFFDQGETFAGPRMAFHGTYHRENIQSIGIA